MPHLLDQKNVDMLTSHGVYSEAELKARCETILENYCKTIIIEANTMIDMAKTQIMPAMEAYCADTARSATAKKALSSALSCRYEAQIIGQLSALTDQAADKTEELEAALRSLRDAKNSQAEAVMIRSRVLPLMNELRLVCDEAETITAKSYWPFPSYADLLFRI